MPHFWRRKTLETLAFPLKKLKVPSFQKAPHSGKSLYLLPGCIKRRKSFFLSFSLIAISLKRWEEKEWVISSPFFLGWKFGPPKDPPYFASSKGPPKRGEGEKWGLLSLSLFCHPHFPLPNLFPSFWMAPLGERGFSEQQHVTDQLTRISLTSCTGVFAYGSLRSGVVKFFAHWKLMGGSHTLEHYRFPPRKSRLKKVKNNIRKTFRNMLFFVGICRTV